MELDLKSFGIFNNKILSLNNNINGSVAKFKNQIQGL